MTQTCTTSNSPTESQALNLVCRVCNAPAHGYNFDQITCESCKAFFRRNALRNTVKTVFFSLFYLLDFFMFFVLASIGNVKMSIFRSM